MARKNFTVEQIIVKLQEVELHCNQGKTITEACRGAWDHRANVLSLAKRIRWNEHQWCPAIKKVEKENGRLKKLVAEQALDISILRDVNSKNF